MENAMTDAYFLPEAAAVLAIAQHLWYHIHNSLQGVTDVRLQESGEMYLEAILVLFRKNGHVRSVDISEYLGYSKPSVSRAVGLLKTGEYISVDHDGSITLTDSGREIAEKIYERHTVLTELLVRMGVSRDVAAADACRLEHAISDESFQAIKNYAQKILEKQ
jgi:Mn-dependent DtxR family transcriptional regulator